MASGPEDARDWAAATPARASGRALLGFGIHHKLPVADRLVGHRALEDAPEHQAAAPAGAAVEPEDELVEVAREVSGVHGALVCVEQPALGQRGDPMDAGQQRVLVPASGASGSLAEAGVGVADA